MNILGILRRRLSTPRVASRYPEVDQPPGAAFRGSPELHPDACQGAAACAEICPTRAIRVAPSTDGWTWQLDLAACIGCGLCIEACPHGALSASPAYELAARSRADLVTTAAFHRASAAQLAGHL